MPEYGCLLSCEGNKLHKGEWFGSSSGSSWQIMLHIFYILIIMTSLQPTQAKGLGSGMTVTKVPLSIQTHDGVVVYGMVLSSSPTWLGIRLNMI